MSERRKNTTEEEKLGMKQQKAVIKGKHFERKKSINYTEVPKAIYEVQILFSCRTAENILQEILKQINHISHTHLKV